MINYIYTEIDHFLVKKHDKTLQESIVGCYDWKTVILVINLVVF